MIMTEIATISAMNSKGGAATISEMNAAGIIIHSEYGDGVYDAEIPAEAAAEMDANGYAEWERNGIRMAADA